MFLKMYSITEQIIKDISVEKNLPYFVVEDIVRSQFKIINDFISERKKECIKLTHIGKFTFNTKRDYKISQVIKSKNLLNE